LFNDQELMDEMVNVSVEVYARHFTAAELREITAFYRSPVGTKLLAKMPELQQESMRASQRVILPRVMKIADQWIADFTKK
jgi:hypothetical protein